MKKPAEDEPVMPDDVITIGILGHVYGLQGDIKLHPLSDVPDRFTNLRMVWWIKANNACCLLQVKAIRPQGQEWLARFEGYDSPESVTVLSGGRIALPAKERGQLAPDHYFIDDILGLSVEEQSGRILGQIVDVYHTGANDVYVVQGEQGEILLPAVQHVILKIDLARRHMWVHLLEGLEA